MDLIHASFIYMMNDLI